MAQHRHKRETHARRLASLAGARAAKLALGAAAAATLPAVALGVVAADPSVSPAASHLPGPGRTFVDGPRHPHILNGPNRARHHHTPGNRLRSNG